MSVAKLVAFLRALPDAKREEMIARMQPEEQGILRSLLASAGNSSAATVEEVARELAGAGPVRRR